MRAVLPVDGRPNFVDLPVPEPGAGEALVRVHATALNRADLLQVAGSYPPPPGAPETLGLELAGEIVAFGEQERAGARWTVGDRVMALVGGGGYAEYAVVPCDLLMPVPDSLSFTDAAAIPEAYLTAWSNMVEIARLTAGETVLVHAGASGVGLAATRIARELGARVCATASRAKHLVCLDAGATIVIDYTTEVFADRLECEGIGVDVIVDLIGAPYWNDNIRALNRWGRIVYIGLQGGGRVEVNLGDLMSKRLGVFGSTLRNRTADEKADLVRRFRAWADERFASGALVPDVWRVMPFGEVDAAHEAMRARENAGKIVLQVVGS